MRWIHGAGSCMQVPISTSDCLFGKEADFQLPTSAMLQLRPMQASCGADDDTRRLTTSYLYNGEGSNAMTYDDHVNDIRSLALQSVLYS